MSVPVEYLRRHAIEQKNALRHAVVHLHMGIFSHTPGMADWRGVNVGKPTVIYDLNGEPLFFDFPALSPERKQIGLLRASANRALGTAVPTAYVGKPTWDIEKAIERARRIVRSEYRAEIIATRPVCYSYPKLGIAVTWRGRTREEGRTIIDVGDFTIVPERVEPELRGPGAWSLYDHMSEEFATKAVERFGFYDKLLDDLQERTGLDLTAKLTMRQFNLLQTALVSIIPLYSTAHLNLHMHGQETSYWCTVATGQMILEFHGYNYTQAQIAAAMGTNTGGTSWAGEETGLESLTNNQFDAQADYQPSFGKAKAEIDAQRPFDYSYPTHSMACSGYRQQNYYLAGTQPEYSLELYDPWPVNQGTIRWETWGAKTVAGFMYLRHI